MSRSMSLTPLSDADVLLDVLELLDTGSAAGFEAGWCGTRSHQCQPWRILFESTSDRSVYLLR